MEPVELNWMCVSFAQKALQQDRYAVKKYAELADQSAENTVEGGVSTLQEATADYDGYTGGAYDRGTWLGGAGYLCPSDVVYGRPVRARNTNGQWRVLVQNVAGYTQVKKKHTHTHNEKKEEKTAHASKFSTLLPSKCRSVMSSSFILFFREIRVKNIYMYKRISFIEKKRRDDDESGESKVKTDREVREKK